MPIQADGTGYDPAVCGIAGVVHLTRARGVDPAVVVDMGAVLAHRGPDAAGTWRDGRAALAHRRLAIIDLAGGRQPMRSAATGAVLTFNGEIYNYRSLRRDLAGEGVAFVESGDTEVVLAAYDRWGDGCVDRLDGMFAFAIWDPGRMRLFAARDRLGIKPFYYRWDGGTLLFASELKALVAAGGARFEIDGDSLDQYFRHQYIPGPATIFKDVRQLPAGCTLTATPEAGVVERRFWAPRPARDTPTAPNDVVECRARLATAVDSHLVADVPVGALLSGGLDSSLVVALMSRERPEPIHTFSIGFEGGPQYDERAAARRAADYLKTQHHDRLVTDADAEAGLPDLVTRMDEPLADYAVLPTFFVSELAAREVKVVLTGEGADELFGGYRRYWKERMLAPLDLFRRPYRSTHLFAEEEVARLRGRPRAGSAPAARWGSASGDAQPPGTDRLAQCAIHDIEGWLADDLLVKVDRMTMLCSLEARVPYLDHRLVEFALSVPAHRKVNLWTGARKILLREAARDLLPPDIVNRPKHGFTPPVDAWFRAGVGRFAREALLSNDARIRDHVDVRAVRRLFDDHAAGRDRGHKLWSLLVFELWSRQRAVV
jgi:asparagine synthase (glutamine-hydrolysing)